MRPPCAVYPRPSESKRHPLSAAATRPAVISTPAPLRSVLYHHAQRLAHRRWINPLAMRGFLHARRRSTARIHSKPREHLACRGIAVDDFVHSQFAIQLELRTCHGSPCATAQPPAQPPVHGPGERRRVTSPAGTLTFHCVNECVLHSDQLEAPMVARLRGSSMFRLDDRLRAMLPVSGISTRCCQGVPYGLPLNPASMLRDDVNHASRMPRPVLDHRVAHIQQRDRGALAYRQLGQAFHPPIHHPINRHL